MSAVHATDGMVPTEGPIPTTPASPHESSTTAASKDQEHHHDEAPVNDDSDNEETEEVEITFANDAEAEAARQVGLALYNQGKYEEALDAQYAVVRHFTAKYGMVHPQCGLYYLDYGLSQLRVIQSRDSSAAAIAPLDQEGLETCFMNLDAARVCFEKMEKQKGLSPSDEEDVQLRLAETRNAIAQVNIEQEDYDKALQEYENEVLIYRSLTTPQPRKLVSALYGIAECYMKECDFEQAEVWYNKILDEIAKHEGLFDEELIKELEQLRDEARDMKGGNFATLQELVREQFLPKEVEEQILKEEEKTTTTTATSSSPLSATTVVSAAGGNANPFLSAVPMSESGSLGFGSAAPSGSYLHAAPVSGEHSNSQSISLFRPQGHSRSELPPGPINQHVAVKKKPKVGVAVSAVAGSSSGSLGEQSDSSLLAPPTPTTPAAGHDDEPAKKKARVEA